MELVLKAKTSTFFGPVVAMPCPGDGQVTVVRGAVVEGLPLQGTNIFDLGRKENSSAKSAGWFFGICDRFWGMGESSSN